MKRILSVIWAAALLAGLSSCQKEKHSQFRGDYSYNIGGYVELEEVLDPVEPVETEDGQEPSEPVVPATLKSTVASERGVMHILDSGDGLLTVTLSPVVGSAWKFDASADGGTMTIPPVERTVSLSPGGSVFVTVGGTGRVVDGSVIFEISLEGEVIVKDALRSKTYRIKESHVSFFADSI